MALGDLLHSADRVIAGDESDEDLEFIFAPGSSLGGARPKASVLDQHGVLSIAKFPKETDEYSVEGWEAVALRLAALSGINVAKTSLKEVRGRKVLLSERFDRAGGVRIAFRSAMAMTGHKDGEQGSYLELLDILAQYGAKAEADRQELFRRMIFNVLISNTDDHLRNHGFLWTGGDAGWILSPAYDINPTPQDLKPRILATAINYDDGTCSVELIMSVAEYFGFKLADAKVEIQQIAKVVSCWQDIAIEIGLPRNELSRMSSAFEHEDTKFAL